MSAAAKSIGEHFQGAHAVVVNRPTVPIGSGSWVDSLLRDV
ncbi:MAG: hypothetical protein ACRD7E_31585 [Bryobacteraceae bacterium]